MDTRSTQEFDVLRIVILVITLVGLCSLGAMLLESTSESTSSTSSDENSSENSELQLEEEEFTIRHAIYYYVEPELDINTITVGVYEGSKHRAEVTLCAVPTMKKVVPNPMFSTFSHDGSTVT